MSWATVVSDTIILVAYNFPINSLDVMTSRQVSKILDTEIRLKLTMKPSTDGNGDVVEFTMFSSRQFLAEVGLKHRLPDQTYVDILPGQRKYLVVAGNAWNLLGEVRIALPYHVPQHFKFEIGEIKSDDIFAESVIVEKLSDLFISEKYSDIVITSNDNKKFRAHKLILKCSSPVFAAMLKHDMKENETNSINIDDMDSNLVQEMLSYMYTGKCANVKKNAVNLLNTAEKYELNDLKKLCERTLIGEITTDNVIEYYIMADRFNTEDLKERIHKFIKDNGGLKPLINTEGWNVLTGNLFRQMIENTVD